MPALKKGEPLNLLGLFPEQHFTQPPPRYSEATLVKTLEEKGIGRPSTYAPILSTIQERGYVHQVERRLQPTELGFLVNDLLVEHFPEVVDVGFTAQMEEGLDRIAQGEREWVPLMKEFYGPFSASLERASRDMERVKPPEEVTDEVCDLCGRPMVVKHGRFGRFLACSGYPECKRSRDMETVKPPEEVTDEVCDLCGRPMVVKHGRFGRFLACSGYPECKRSRSILVKTGVACPRCGGDLVEKRSKKGRRFYGCSRYPQCDFTAPQRPVAQACSACGGLMVAYGPRQARCISCGRREVLGAGKREAGEEVRAGA